MEGGGMAFPGRPLAQTGRASFPHPDCWIRHVASRVQNNPSVSSVSRPIQAPSLRRTVSHAAGRVPGRRTQLFGPLFPRHVAGTGNHRERELDFPPKEKSKQEMPHLP